LSQRPTRIGFLAGVGEMPESGTGWLEILLLSGLAILLAGFLLLSAVEGWRHRSEHRRLRNHFRGSGKPRKIVGEYGARDAAIPSHENHFRSSGKPRKIVGEYVQALERVQRCDPSPPCFRCKAQMAEIVRIDPRPNAPGLIGFECPECGYVTSVVQPNPVSVGSAGPAISISE